MASSNPVDQWAEFAGAVVCQLPRDLPPADMQRYIQDQAALAQALRNGLVSHTGILEALIAKSGITDVNSNITSANFGVTQEPDNRPLHLAHPNKLLTTTQILGYISECQQQAEPPEQLVRYAIENQEAGIKFPIAALGRFWTDPDGDRRYMVSSSNEGRRCLHLFWADDRSRWDEYCRFLVSGVPSKQQP